MHKNYYFIFEIWKVYPNTTKNVIQVKQSLLLYLAYTDQLKSASVVSYVNVQIALNQIG